MKSLLRGAVNQQQIHDAAFAASAAVSAHMCQYESALATTMSKLLVATATHQIKSNAKVVKQNAKVIKHSVKMKVVTEVAPKTIHASHVKALIANAQKSVTMQAMITSGMDRQMALQAAGDIYDPVQGIGTASDVIWGPVM